MINLIRWPISSLAHPDKDVRLVSFPIKTHNNPIFFSFDWCSSQLPSLSSPRAYAPSQFPRFGVIIKELANFGGVWFAHRLLLNFPFTKVNSWKL
jgi:hypothetical protein